MRARNIGKLLSEKTRLTWKLRYTTYNLVVVLQVLGKGGCDSADLAHNLQERKHDESLEYSPVWLFDEEAAHQWLVQLEEVLK